VGDRSGADRGGRRDEPSGRGHLCNVCDHVLLVVVVVVVVVVLVELGVETVTVTPHVTPPSGVPRASTAIWTVHVKSLAEMLAPGAPSSLTSTMSPGGSVPSVPYGMKS
jgi:hypothetical protein